MEDSEDSPPSTSIASPSQTTSALSPCPTSRKRTVRPAAELPAADDAAAETVFFPPDAPFPDARADALPAPLQSAAAVSAASIIRRQAVLFLRPLTGLFCLYICCSPSQAVGAGKPFGLSCISRLFEWSIAHMFDVRTEKEQSRGNARLC